MPKTKILLTGSNGFIGSILSKRLRNTFELYSDRFDVRDKNLTAKIVNEFSPQIIIHLASPTDVNACEENPSLAEETIVKGTENLVGALLHPCRFIFASSMMVYEEPKTGKTILNEDSVIQPINNYGKAKLDAEGLIEEWARRTENTYFNLRIWPHTHKTQVGSRFLSRIFSQLRSTNVVDLPASLHKVGRDIGAAKDLVRCFETLITAKASSGVYNVCTGRARNLARLAQLMAQSLEKEIRFYSAEQIENSYCGSYEKLRLASGWTPNVLTDDDLIRYYLNEHVLD